MKNENSKYVISFYVGVEKKYILDKEKGLPRVFNYEEAKKFSENNKSLQWEECKS